VDIYIYQGGWWSYYDIDTTSLIGPKKLRKRRVSNVTCHVRFQKKICETEVRQKNIKHTFF